MARENIEEKNNHYWGQNVCLWKSFMLLKNTVFQNGEQMLIEARGFMWHSGRETSPP